MKAEGLPFQNMARPQRPVTARERTTSRDIDKGPITEQRPTTSVRRHRTCSACLQVSENVY